MPEHDETDPAQRGDAVEDEGAAHEKDQRPLSRFAARFRVPIGFVVAALGIVLGVLIATEPRDADGVGAVVSQVAAVGVWACVAAVGLMWAIAAPRRVMNLTALGGIACYVVMLITGR